MKPLFTIFLSCTFFFLHAQQTVQFFTTGELYTGITKEANASTSLRFDDPILIDVAFFPTSENIDVKNEFVLGINLQAGLILKEKWYMSMGFRYDTRRFNTNFACPYCFSPGDGYQINSRALEIPISFRYRVIPDLPISPILHTETFLSFRRNGENNDFFSGSQQTKYNSFGYRLGVGLNYQLGSRLELNLIGSWGRARAFSSGGNFFSNNSNDYSYRNGFIKDYQLSLGVLTKIGS